MAVFLFDIFLCWKVWGVFFFLVTVLFYVDVCLFFFQFFSFFVSFSLIVLFILFLEEGMCSLLVLVSYFFHNLRRRDAFHRI